MHELCITKVIHNLAKLSTGYPQVVNTLRKWCKSLLRKDLRSKWGGASDFVGGFRNPPTVRPERPHSSDPSERQSEARPRAERP